MSMQITLDQDYIRVIESAFEPQFCQQVCELFEQDHLRHHHDRDRYIELDIFRSGRQLWQGPGILAQWQPLADHMVSKVVELVSDYQVRWDPLGMMPHHWAMEGLRVKCYRPGEHEFRTHVDQANRDSATRFLAVLIYLNDNDAGTEFFHPKLQVSARQGQVLIFPPNWQYPHRGLMPQKESKYICSTYLHYKD